MAVPSVIRAARALVAERGYDAVTLHAIAERAGVSRQTIYRRWPGKADLVMDALLERALTIAPVEHGDVEHVLFSLLANLFKGLAEDGAAITSLIASAQGNESFRKAFHTKFVAPREEVIRAILQRGIASGELHADADIQVAIDMLQGAFWYRLLLGSRLDDDFARRLSHRVLRAFAPA